MSQSSVFSAYLICWMFLCACAYGVKSEISLDTGDSASNAVVKRSVLYVSINQRCAECVYYGRRVWGQKYIIIMWPFAKKLYHGWIARWCHRMKFHENSPPNWRAGCAPGPTQAHNQLGTRGVRRVFWGAKIFETIPNIFPGGEQKIFRGPSPPSYGPDPT